MVPFISFCFPLSQAKASLMTVLSAPAALKAVRCNRMPGDSEYLPLSYQNTLECQPVADVL